MKRKKQRKLYLYLILILGLTIGFALLSTTLYINGTASIKSSQWNIFWDEESIEETTGSVEATTPAEVTGTKNDTIEFTVDLELPGDFYEFTIDAKNTGSIDGAISDFNTEIFEEDGTTSTTLPSYLKFSVKYDDGTEPKAGDILAKTNGTKKYRVRVEFDSEATTIPSTAEKYVIKYHVDYGQYKEETTTVDEGPVTITASKTTAQKNEEVKVTVTATDVAAWNLHLSGAIVSDEFVGANLDGDGENTTVSREFTLDTSTAGEKVITLTGDVTDEDNHKTMINKTITITVTE